MRDITKVWHSNGFRRHLLIRIWADFFSWRSVWRLVTLRPKYACDRVSFSLRRFDKSNGFCYCPEGSQVDGGISALGVGVHVWYSQDRLKLPCHCDRVIADLTPAYIQEGQHGSRSPAS